MTRKKPDRIGKTGVKNDGEGALKRRLRTCRGSFTVEAVFLFPIIILLIAFMLHLSMDWFENVRQTCEDVDALIELDTRTYFLQQDMLEGIWEALQ
ncbi:MAG: hypothetical protein LUE90_08590 [Clostridiales bacterium]|nr:hypothetical protein [Clostridiales bacterium]